MDLLELDKLNQCFNRQGTNIEALCDVSLSVEPGQLIKLVGPSGSGKSTLLLAAGGMRRPTSGAVRWQGQDVYAMSPGQRTAERSRRIGFVFQTLELVPYLTALDNVMLGASRAVRERAEQLLGDLGLSERLSHRPLEMSVGERQRTALARAMVHEPAMILADEPTGNLDDESALRVFRTLRRFSDDGGAVIVASHDARHDELVTKTVRLRHGRIESAPDTAFATTDSIFPKTMSDELLAEEPTEVTP